MVLSMPINILLKNVLPKCREWSMNFPVIGELTYRGLTLPIYVDDYGCQNFITIDGEDIPIETMGGIWDWYYPIDKHIDGID